MYYRIIEMISYLLEKERYVSYKELSEVINMSVATVRLDVEKVTEYAAVYDVVLETKRGVGCRLIGKPEHLNLLGSSVKSLIMNEQNHISETDFNVLNFLLLNVGKTVTIKDISESFYISESTVWNTINDLKPNLIKFNVSVQAIQGKGIYISGEESHIRKLYSKIVFREGNKLMSYSEPKNLKEKIFNYLNINPEAIFVAVKNCEQALDCSFIDESFQSLIIHIAIALKRIFDGIYVETLEDLSLDKTTLEYKATIKLISDIETAYNVKFNKAELQHLYLHLISTRTIKENFTGSQNTLIDNKLTEITNQIVFLVEDIKKVKVGDEYYENLLIHLRPAVNRLRYNQVLDNPLMEVIKHEYSEAYGIAWMCNSIFIKEMKIELTENEAAYIALHIQAMIEESQRQITAIIICSSGIGISQLMKTQIESRFKDLVILSTDSLMKYRSNRYYEKADFIISTFPIETDKPVITVNKILTEQDIDKIKNFIDNIGEEHDINELMKYVFLQKDWESKESVISNIAMFLENNGIVEKGYHESIIERESIYSTEIGNNVALPHGDGSLVLESQLVIVTLEKPVYWDEFLVDVLMFIQIKESDKQIVTKRLKKIYKKLYTKEFHDAAIAAQSRKDIIQLLM